jgi:hypothetical protein
MEFYAPLPEDITGLLQTLEEQSVADGNAKTTGLTTKPVLLSINIERID